MLVSPFINPVIQESGYGDVARSATTNPLFFLPMLKPKGRLPEVQFCVVVMPLQSLRGVACKLHTMEVASGIAAAKASAYKRFSHGALVDKWQIDLEVQATAFP